MLKKQTLRNNVENMEKPAYCFFVLFIYFFVLYYLEVQDDLGLANMGYPKIHANKQSCRVVSFLCVRKVLIRFCGRPPLPSPLPVHGGSLRDRGGGREGLNEFLEPCNAKAC